MKKIDPLPFELSVPSMVDTGDWQANADITGLLSVIQMGFGDAVVALLSFNAVNAADVIISEQEKSQPKGRALWQQMEQLIAAHDGPDAGRPESVLYRGSQIKARAQIARGEMPRMLRWRLPFIHAKTFIYAADTIGMVLRRLELRSDLAPQFKGVADRFYAALPSLKGLRDSAHHVEDRIRRKKSGEKDIELKGSLVIDFLQGDTFTGTLADGTLGEIAVTEASLEIIRQQVQAVFDSFPAKGPPTYFPGI